jgi:hypothetical protein
MELRPDITIRLQRLRSDNIPANSIKNKLNPNNGGIFFKQKSGGAVTIVRWLKNRDSYTCSWKRLGKAPHMGMGNLWNYHSEDFEGRKSKQTPFLVKQPKSSSNKKT